MTFTPDDAMRQAKMTAHDYMTRALASAKEVLGEDWCHEHPQALATYMAGFAQTAAIDYGATLIAIKMDENCEAMIGRAEDFTQTLANAISDLKPET